MDLCIIRNDEEKTSGGVKYSYRFSSHIIFLPDMINTIFDIKLLYQGSYKRILYRLNLQIFKLLLNLK